MCAILKKKKLQNFFFIRSKIHVQLLPLVKFHKKKMFLLRKISKEAPHFQPASVVLPRKYLMHLPLFSKYTLFIILPVDMPTIY